jgi:hypothetical protein
MRPPGPGGTNGAATAVAAEYFRNSRRLISDVLSARQPLPLCPRFQTYCCFAANDVQGQSTKSLRSSPLRGGRPRGR